MVVVVGEEGAEVGDTFPRLFAALDRLRPPAIGCGATGAFLADSAAGEGGTSKTSSSSIPSGGVMDRADDSDELVDWEPDLVRGDSFLDFPFTPLAPAILEADEW